MRLNFIDLLQQVFYQFQRMYHLYNLSLKILHSYQLVHQQVKYFYIILVNYYNLNKQMIDKNKLINQDYKIKKKVIKMICYILGLQLVQLFLNHTLLLKIYYKLIYIQENLCIYHHIELQLKVYNLLIEVKSLIKKIQDKLFQYNKEITNKEINL